MTDTAESFEEESGADVGIDWVVVGTAGSMGEALCICSALEESEIPCRSEGGSIMAAMSSGALEHRIMAPRQMAQKAGEIIAAARKNAELEGIRQAFSGEGVEEKLDDASTDKITQKMLSLREADPEHRAEALANHLAEWLAQGMSLPKIAEYLAVAGLDRPQAKILLKEVSTNEIGRFHAAQRRQIGYGVALASLGLFVFLGYLMAAVARGPFDDMRLNVGGGICFVIGLGMAYSAATRKVPYFPDEGEIEKENADNTSENQSN